MTPTTSPTHAPTTDRIGENCPICGPASGTPPTATGAGAVAMGIGTTATASAAVAMGKGITANETESLALSGIAYAKNFYFNSDPRLINNVTNIDPATMLRHTEKLRVVAHTPSDNLCRHQGLDPAQCARDVSVGLLAAHDEGAAAIPGAVRSGTSLTLGDRRGRVLEQVDDVRSLDVRALLAQLVGSVQALSAENRALRGDLRAVQDELRRVQ